LVYFVQKEKIVRMRRTPVYRTPALWVGTALICPPRKRSDWAVDTTARNVPLDTKMSKTNVKACIDYILSAKIL
jgi:hypothetical protein